MVCLCSVAWAIEPVQPIPEQVDYDPAQAALGKQLFFDVRLSVDDSRSCESCHFFNQGGADALHRSVGANGLLSKRNSPTIFNVVFNFRQLWDGRAEDLQEQINQVIINPTVMGMPSWDALVDKLSAIDEYQQAFQAVYGGSITAQRIQQALVEYEKTLITPNSPFDAFLKGDLNAISARAQKGYALFKSYGCSSCHQGINVGGNMFQKFGVLKDINLRKNNVDTDLGRYQVTNNEWDKRVFKVPSLRMVSLTAPYFHDGSVATLSEAIDVMTEFQLGRRLPDEHKAAIIEFLKTLPGELPVEARP